MLRLQIGFHVKEPFIYYVTHVRVERIPTGVTERDGGGWRGVERS